MPYSKGHDVLKRIVWPVFGCLMLGGMGLGAGPGPTTGPVNPANTNPAAPSGGTTTGPAATMPVAAAMGSGDSAAMAGNMKKMVAVTGVVARAQLSKSGKIFRIEFTDSAASGFVAVIFPRNLKAFQDQWGENLDKAWVDKSITVTGILVDYQGKPEIVLSSPVELTVKP